MILGIAHSCILFSIAFLVSKKQHAALRIFFWPALAIKAAAGIALGLVYTYYYSEGDTFLYYQDAVNLAEVAVTDLKSYLTFLYNSEQQHILSQLSATQPRALFFSKILSVFCLFTGNNYWILGLYLSVISFFTAWFFVINFHKRTISATPAIIGFLFFPSIVFWSSGVVKESLAMACLFYLSGIFLKLYYKERFSTVWWLLIPLSIWLLWNLKYYYLAVFMPVAVTTLVMRLVIERVVVFKYTVIKTAVWLVVFIVPVYIVSSVHPNFYPERFLDVIVSNYEAYIALSHPEDVIVYPGLHQDLWTIVRYIPKAVASAIYRPFIMEASSVFQYVVSIENLFLLTITAGSLYNLIKPKNRFKSTLILPLLVYVIILSAFLALSTPNFGTLSRYRIAFLPFFVLLICLQNPLLNSLRWISRTARLSK